MKSPTRREAIAAGLSAAAATFITVSAKGDTLPPKAADPHWEPGDIHEAIFGGTARMRTLTSCMVAAFDR